MIVLLDSGPLGLICHPNHTPARAACDAWLERLLDERVRVVVPEIVDYELRRELIRIGSTAAVARLDEFVQARGYLALTTTTMRLAARFWADARTRGIKTADDRALDVDMILAAQAASLPDADAPVIATTNVRHLAAFTSAEHWSAVAAP